MLTDKLIGSSVFDLHLARKLLWRGIRILFVCLWRVHGICWIHHTLCIHRCFYNSNVLGSFIIEVCYFFVGDSRHCGVGLLLEINVHELIANEDYGSVGASTA